MNIYEKLAKIQSRLKVPKNQYNNFGKYSYRSLEDIQEAVKPLLSDTKTVLIITDSVEQIGSRFYLTATASLHDCEGDNTGCIQVQARAREAETKKGMDESQITGAASSYARKYALNGLFALDDNKDADHGDNRPERAKEAAKPNSKGNTKANDKGQLKEDMKAIREEIEGYLNSNWLTADKKDAGKKFMAGNPPLEKLEKFRDSLLKIYGEWQAAHDGAKETQKKNEKPSDKPPERQWECLVCGTKSADGSDVATSNWKLVATQQSGPHTALCKSHSGETADSLLSQAEQAEEEGRKEDALRYSKAAGILADMEAATQFNRS